MRAATVLSALTMVIGLGTPVGAATYEPSSWAGWATDVLGPGADASATANATPSGVLTAAAFAFDNAPVATPGGGYSMSETGGTGWGVSAGSGGADMRFTRDLEPGRYVVEVRFTDVAGSASIDGSAFASVKLFVAASGLCSPSVEVDGSSTCPMGALTTGVSKTGAVACAPVTDRCSPAEITTLHLVIDQPDARPVEIAAGLWADTTAQGIGRATASGGATIHSISIRAA